MTPLSLVRHPTGVAGGLLELRHVVVEIFHFDVDLLMKKGEMEGEHEEEKIEEEEDNKTTKNKEKNEAKRKSQREKK